MSETNPTPPPAEKTVVVNPSPNLGRLSILTIVSLLFNGLILLLLVAGAVVHHHRHHHHRGFGGGCPECSMGGGDRHWQRHGGFGGRRFGGYDRENFGENRSPDRDGGPRSFGPPSGMPGMGMGMHGGPKGPPNPAEITDKVLHHLTEKLTLTDDEQAKIKPIIEQQVTDFVKQMEAQRAARQKQFEDIKARIKPLLDAGQQKQLDAMPLPGHKPGEDQPATSP
jgi:hypothetical protein